MSNLSLYSLSLKLQDVLSDYIGTWENGDKAFWVEPPQCPYKCDSLACYIKKEPEQFRTYGSTSNQKAIHEFYVVTLVQYDPNDVLISGLRAIQSNFSIASCDAISGDEKVPSQAIIRINNYGFI